MKKTLLFVAMIFASASMTNAFAEEKKKKPAAEKKAKAKPEAIEVSGTLAIKGKKAVLTIADGSKINVMDKKKFEEVKKFDGKSVKISGKAVNAKNGKVIKKVDSISEAAAE